MRIPPSAVAFSLIFAASALSQAPPPNLSGVWRANPEKGKYSNKPPDSMAFKIEQDGAQINIALRVRNGANEESQTFHYRIGADDNKNEMHGAPMLSRVHWDGKALVTDAVAMFGNKELHMNDRWTLSDDGQTLRFQERHQFGSEAAEEEDMIFEKQPDNSWQPDAKPKLAEEAFKNIQVMKGMPATRLMPVMNLFTKWLGVECSYCHVPNDFPSDNHLAKNTARKMLKMVHTINDDNFPETHPVTCWTCHRGSAKPAAFPQ